MKHLFFDQASVLLRTLLIGVMAYTTLILFLRVSGKRILSKMNAFDLVVTISLGSTLASIMLNKDVAPAQGALALAVLIGLQFIITWSSIRARWIRKLVTGAPALLFYRGEFLDDSLRSERVTQDEIRAAIRSAGLNALADVEAVVLETDGSFSVVRRSQTAPSTSLAEIRLPTSLPGQLAGD